VADQFPGPTIEARSGDILEFEVLNLAEDGVSLHWHGLHMRGNYGAVSWQMESVLTDI
jgi:FtsP/CotA-like multicopper oxidase with cupredoxin domain